MTTSNATKRNRADQDIACDSSDSDDIRKGNVNHKRPKANEPPAAPKITATTKDNSHAEVCANALGTKSSSPDSITLSAGTGQLTLKSPMNKTKLASPRRLNHEVHSIEGSDDEAPDDAKQSAPKSKMQKLGSGLAKPISKYALKNKTIKAPSDQIVQDATEKLVTQANADRASMQQECANMFQTAAEQVFEKFAETHRQTQTSYAAYQNELCNRLSEAVSGSIATAVRQALATSDAAAREQVRMIQEEVQTQVMIIQESQQSFFRNVDKKVAKLSEIKQEALNVQQEIQTMIQAQNE